MAPSPLRSQPTRPAADRDVRFIGDLAGCYVLSSREAAAEDQPKVFACRSRSISPKMVVLEAPVSGEIGEQLALRFDGVGLLRASIIRKTRGGFVAEFLTSTEEQAALARRIDWMKRKQLRTLADLRAQRRWIPRDPHSTIVLAGNRRIDCFVINISASGVAVSADFMPEMGQPLAVGVIMGRVVRRFDSGFAVAFLAAQDPLIVESLLGSLRATKGNLAEDALAKAEADVAAALGQEGPPVASA